MNDWSALTSEVSRWSLQTLGHLNSDVLWSRGRTFAKRGGVAVDVDHGDRQSATLGLEIESVDQDLSQVGGVDPWNSAAVIS